MTESKMTECKNNSGVNKGTCSVRYNSASQIMFHIGSFYQLNEKNYFRFLGTLQVVSEPNFNTKRPMGVPSIYCKENKVQYYICYKQEIFLFMKSLKVQETFY